MKKLLSVIYMVTFTLLSIQALAADTIIEENIDVKAKWIQEDLENSSTLGEEKPITLRDGTVITIKGTSKEDSDIRATVILVTEEEKEAYLYVTDMTKEYGQNPYVFYILFYKDGVEVTPSKPVIVTVKIPDGYENASLYFFTGDGKTPEKLKCDTKTDMWTFEVSDSGYFAMLLPKKAETPTPTPGADPTTSTNTTTSTSASTSTSTATSTTKFVNTNTVATTRTTGTTSTASKATTTTARSIIQTLTTKTGDNTPILFWVTVLVISGVLIVVIMTAYRKRQKN